MEEGSSQVPARAVDLDFLGDRSVLHRAAPPRSGRARRLGILSLYDVTQTGRSGLADEENLAVGPDVEEGDTIRMGSRPQECDTE